VTGDLTGRNTALSGALPYLACPVCGAGLTLAGPSVRCVRGHCFDIARQGYLNLRSGQAAAGTADTPAMAAAREAFLGEGHYAPIADALTALAAGALAAGGLAAGAAARPVPGIVLDLAGGTGYYLAAMLDSPAGRAGAAGGAPDDGRGGRAGVCVDVSKPALRRAARCHPRAAAVGADVWGRLPVAGGSAAVVMSVFGPRNPAETRRVLAPGGVYLLVTPTGEHLRELIAPLGMLTVDPEKPGRLAAAMSDFGVLAEQRLSYRAGLRRAQARNLVMMGPSGHHVVPAELEPRLAALPDPVMATISVRAVAYRPRAGGAPAAGPAR